MREPKPMVVRPATPQPTPSALILLGILREALRQFAASRDRVELVGPPPPRARFDLD